MTQQKRKGDSALISAGNDRHTAIAPKPSAPKANLMYSDNWLKKGYTKGNKIRASSIVNYQVWLNHDDVAVGVTVNFEFADAFHYELMTAEWNKFLTDVLSIEDIVVPPAMLMLRSFFAKRNGLFAFEESLDVHKIRYKKVAYY